MADYRNLPLNPNGQPPTSVSVAAVPLQATSPQVAHQSQAALDSLIGSGHRVVYEIGLRGGPNFLVPDGADPVQSARVYPDLDTGRVVGRGENLSLTPGHLLGIDVMALPSGPTQGPGAAPNHADTGASGRYLLEVTYINGDLDTVDSSATVVIPASEEPQSGEPVPAHGNLFIASVVADIGGLEPDTELDEKFLRGNDVTASWVLTAIGSPRPIDVAVVERGVGVTVDHASTKWPTNMYTGAGGPYQGLPVDYPVEQLTTTDPGAGTIAIGRALLEHGRQLGPILFWWGSASEHVNTLLEWISYDGGTGDDEAPPFTGSGTTPLHIPFGAAHNSNFPAFLLGHYARQVEHGDAFLDGRTGVIPVWVYVYIKSADATVTVHTGANNDGWSAIRVSTTADVWQWERRAGHLEVGTGPEDAPPGRMYVEGAGDWALRYACVFFRVT